MKTALCASIVCATGAMLGASAGDSSNSTKADGRGTSTALRAVGDDAAQAAPVVAGDSLAAQHTPIAKLKFEHGGSGLPTQGMWKCDPVFGDVNGDGHLDLAAIPRLSDGVRVWLGDGKGNWTDSSNGLRNPNNTCGGGLSLVDVNHDSKLDVVAACHCSGVYVFLGDGAGNWSEVVSQLNPVQLDPTKPIEEQADYKKIGAEDLATGDVNGDGHIDIVASAADEAGIMMYLGDGTGTNWTLSTEGLPKAGWAYRVSLVDMNADGRLDILTSFSAGPRVLINDGNGSWTNDSKGLPSPQMKGVYMAIAPGDVNGDGRMDFAVANWVDGPEVYIRQEDGSWRRGNEILHQLIGGSVGLDMADINRDGHLDIVFSGRMTLDPGYVRGVFAMRGDGKGGFEWMEDCGLPATGMGAVAGMLVTDVNKDGIHDIVAASGLLVEQSREAAEPVIKDHMILWFGRSIED